MEEIYLLDLNATYNFKGQVFSREIFFNCWNIHHRYISNLKEWKAFVRYLNYSPKHYFIDLKTNGCDFETIQALDKYGYVPDTECYTLDCYYYQGVIYISPYQNQITTGEHISQAWKMLVNKIESDGKFKIYTK